MPLEQLYPMQRAPTGGSNIVDVPAVKQIVQYDKDSLAVSLILVIFAFVKL